MSWAHSEWEPSPAVRVPAAARSASSGESASDISGDCGGLEVNEVTGWHGDDGIEGEGGEKQLQNLPFFWLTSQHGYRCGSRQCRFLPIS